MKLGSLKPRWLRHSFIHNCARVGYIALKNAAMDPALGEQIFYRKADGEQYLQG